MYPQQVAKKKNSFLRMWFGANALFNHLHTYETMCAIDSTAFEHELINFSFWYECVCELNKISIERNKEKCS